MNRSPKLILFFICFMYLAMSAIFGTTQLDCDEFSFIREPYEIIGGDYTIRYLADHDLASALDTARKSYYLYWKYRPLFYPIISEKDKKLFEVEEKKFGYIKPEPSPFVKRDSEAYEKYSRRLIVPEPDRFYSHNAGKPLLPAILSIPQLALVKLVTSERENLLFLQYNHNYHPVFILVRLVQIAAGLASILIIYWILAREYDTEKALLGASIMAVFPLSIQYFPNLHHDSILVPFVILAVYFFSKGQYKRAGVFWGLALASKNVAIFLLPAFLVFLIWDVWSLRRTASKGAEKNLMKPRIKGLAMAITLGFLILVPFANPISYTREILTPVTGRNIDSRGVVDVSRYTIAGQIGTDGKNESAKGDEGWSVVRPELVLAKKVLRFVDADFFFLVLAFYLLLIRPKTPLFRISLILLLFTIPFRVVFGHGLGYRQLFFVPFAVMLWVDVVPKRYIIGLLAVLLCMDFLYCIDPITTNTFHSPVNKETFVGAFTRWIGIH